MATGEKAGSVYVTIDGDYSPLLAKYAQLQGVSEASGKKIASALSSGLTSGTGLVDQFGRSIQSSFVAPLRAAEPAVSAVTQSLGRMAGAAESTVTPMQATGGAIRTAFGEQSIRAVEKFLTLIPGIGPLLQAAFPIIGALALGSALARAIGEGARLNKTVEELKTATKDADEAFSHMVHTLDELGAKDIGRDLGAAAGARARAGVLRDEARDAEDAIGALVVKLLQLDKDKNDILKNPGLSLPIVSGQIKEAYKNQIQGVREQIDGLTAKIKEKNAEAEDALKDAAKTGLEDSGRADAERVSNRISSLERMSAAERQHANAGISAALELRKAEIDALRDPGDRAVETAKAEVEAAEAKANQILVSETALTAALIREIDKRAAAESRGKTPIEVGFIGQRSAGEKAAVRDTSTEKITAGADAAAEANAKLAAVTAEVERKAAQDTEEAWIKAFASIEIVREASQKREEERLLRQSDALARAAEIQEKSEGDIAALKTEAEKIKLERAYGLEVVHTAQQQIQFARQIADLNTRERQQRIEGLQRELNATPNNDEPANIERRARLESEIAEAKQRAANDDAKDAAIIDEQNQRLTQQLTIEQQIAAIKNSASRTATSNQQKIGEQIGDAIGNLPKEIGDDIGNSIAGALLGKHPGESIGQAMAKALADSLKKTAQDLLGKLISGGVQFGIGALLGFADGGNPPVGVPSIVGEHGPELFIPREAGSIVPNHALASAGSGGYYASSSSSTGDIHFHAHGMVNPDAFIQHVATKLPAYLKTKTATLSRYSR